MLVRHFEAQSVSKMLGQFAFYKMRHKVDRNYQVWEDGAHPQLLQSHEMLIQKLEYIHQNPVKRGYVDVPADWRYLGARNYEGQSGLIDVYTVYTQWGDWFRNA